jgi:hypothetical protein
VTPILIDTGPSPRGFHRLEQFLTCPMRYYWNRQLRLAAEAAPDAPEGAKADPLVRGTLGHVLMAHHYARLTAVARGRDPEQFYSPRDAAAIVADRYGDQGRRLLTDAMRGFDAHARTYAVERFDVIGIEKLLETWFPGSGSPDPRGWWYTARADMVVRMKDTGKVWIVDHKYVGRVGDESVFRRYTLSGQFLGLYHLGNRIYGSDFAGLMLNVVACDASNRCVRRGVDPAPWALQRFPDLVAQTELRIRDLEDLPVTAWPMAVSEIACVTPYGICAHFERCRWGR